jgi:ribosome maturation factor RimP
MHSPEIVRLLEPSISALGFELVAVELVGSGDDRILRVYIDHPDGITVDDCADVSRQVSAVLDVEDPIPGAYVLEVSSPGLDRPLVKAADFERFRGSLVKLRTREAVLGRKNFTGMLSEASGDNVVVEVDGEPYEIEFANIEKARLVPDLS